MRWIADKEVNIRPERPVRRLRCRRRHLLLWLVCINLLAQEMWVNA